MTNESPPTLPDGAGLLFTDMLIKTTEIPLRVPGTSQPTSHRSVISYIVSCMQIVEELVEEQLTKTLETWRRQRLIQSCFISFRPLLLDWTLALPAGLLMGMSLQSVQLLDLHTHSILFECGNS